MTQLKITGMTCARCQHAVRQALESIDGVSGVSVDLDRGVAHVEGDADVTALVAAVAEEGYQATSAAKA